jgi:hypothetical protein
MIYLISHLIFTIAMFNFKFPTVFDLLLLLLTITSRKLKLRGNFLATGSKLKTIFFFMLFVGPFFNNS